MLDSVGAVDVGTSMPGEDFMNGIKRGSGPRRKILKAELGYLSNYVGTLRVTDKLSGLFPEGVDPGPAYAEFVELVSEEDLEGIDAWILEHLTDQGRAKLLNALKNVQWKASKKKAAKADGAPKQPRLSPELIQDVLEYTGKDSFARGVRALLQKAKASDKA